MTHQVAVTIRAPLRPGTAAAAQGRLAALRSQVEADGGPFRDLPSVHFARVFVMPGEADAGEGTPGPGEPAAHRRARSRRAAGHAAARDTLVYMADVDAPGHAHLCQLAAAGPGDAARPGAAAAALFELFNLCEAFPGPGSDRAARLRWLRGHRVRTAALYVHRVGRTVRQVRGEAELRTRIADFLDDPGHDWAGTDAVEVHARVRDFVRAQPDLDWALRPPPRPGLVFRTRQAVATVAVPAVIVALLPLLVAVLPAWAVALRRLERGDEPEHGRPAPEHLADLCAIEDHGAQNPFTAAGEIKPGLLRRVTINVVLRGLDYASRHVYRDDNLAGVRTIHFARWVPLDDGRRLVFASSYDGSLESYMDDFIDRLAWGLNLVFSNGVGYPPTRWLLFGGARHEQDFKRYLRRHQLPSVWYTAYRELTVRNIDENTRLREGLTRDLGPHEVRSWLELL